ncbi:hypothetical protein [Selenomonas sp. AB3002]|uniref:hypothetical protein n=1 Tax=Selenomonas sp. AB3002 TaxID=1392502 RepID=UPI001639C7C6
MSQSLLHAGSWSRPGYFQGEYEEAEAQYMRPRVPCGRPRPSATSAWCSRTWLQCGFACGGQVLIIYQREGSYVQPGTPVAWWAILTGCAFPLSMKDIEGNHPGAGGGRVSEIPQQQAGWQGLRYGLWRWGTRDRARKSRLS